ncbi:MAG: PIG-L deacetylase family protein [Paracoccaceae bacterium]
MDDPFGTGASILVLAPHPDDEALGCGGLLRDVWSRGGRAHVACITDGAASHPMSRSHPPAVLAELRRAELSRAVAILGGKQSDLTWLGFPDAGTHLIESHDGALSRAVAAVVGKVGANILLAPSPLDPHCDHETTAHAARFVAANHPGIRLFYYPVWSAWHARRTDAPVPYGSVTLTRPHPHRAIKRAAIEAHRSQRGMVVQDDPDGFTMPPGFTAWFADRPETYFRAVS